MEPQQRHRGAAAEAQPAGDISNLRSDLSFSIASLLSIFLFQVPSASVTVEGNPALNRVRWANSGKEIAVGDSDGRVFVYEVGEVRLRADFDLYSAVITAKH